MRQRAYSEAARCFSQCLALFNQPGGEQDSVYLTAVIQLAEMAVHHGVSLPAGVSAEVQLQALLASMPEPPVNGLPAQSQDDAEMPSKVKQAGLSYEQTALIVARLRHSLAWAMAKGALDESVTRADALAAAEGPICEHFEAAYQLRLRTPGKALAAESLNGLAAFLHRVGNLQVSRLVPKCCASLRSQAIAQRPKRSCSSHPSLHLEGPA